MKEIFELKPLIHQLIIMELMHKTLIIDKDRLANLKMGSVLEEWYELKLKDVFEEIRQLKSKLSKDGCKLLSEQRDDMFTTYEVVVRGTTFDLTYSHIALRNWCRQEMKRLLGMEYRTPDDLQ